MYMSRFWFRFFLICVVIAISVSLTGLCSAQNVLYDPWISYAQYPFWQPISPSVYYPSFPSAYVPWVRPFVPSLAPATSLLPVDPALTLPRVGAATVITIPTANTATTSAPLGTLNLTPSTLVFLILLFTLH